MTGKPEKPIPRKPRDKKSVGTPKEIFGFFGLSSEELDIDTSGYDGYYEYVLKRKAAEA